MADNVVYDKAIAISADELSDFAAAPEAFLKERGAMEGIPEFNGVYSESGERLDKEGVIDVSALSEVRATIIIAHEPIPYPNPCTWHIWL
ncbi:hypothetical protein [Pseudaestuariivita atlantica]|uniref:hypothetical protein n=1 Tax=Pseudaestuariivita atlantica TaxID=1317121 RepID=UPI00106CE425|nr:hypothetical protein [Pseudaestuariivita atlantica]